MLRIGVTFDLRKDYLAQGYSEEETAEFDAEVTIDGLCDALAGLGFAPVRIGNVKALVQRLAAGERWDGVFNFCEGLNGLSREAQVPAILDAYDIPYVFSDPLTMAVTLDKAMCKRIVRDCGVPTADFALIERIEDVDTIALPFPLFLKPVAEGSGKGIGTNNKVADRAAMRATAADLLARFKQPVLVEPFLAGREFTVGITGTGADAAVLGVSEIVPLAGYHGDGYGPRQQGGLARPARHRRRAAGRGESRRRRRARGVALPSMPRRRANRHTMRFRGQALFIEVNPLAGLRPEYSDMCFIAAREGISYRELIGRIMDSFLRRYPALAK